jgi:AcrR family transcriptional regulator
VPNQGRTALVFGPIGIVAGGVNTSGCTGAYDHEIRGGVVSGTPGRPLSTELSEQLVSVAVDILADEGWGRLNSDRIAARARAGKAGIYRRWPSMAALAGHAVGRFTLVTVPEDTGSLRGDLLGLVWRWTTPLDREERAAAGVVGAARHEDELRRGLERALVQPLADAVSTLGARSAARGEPVDPHRLGLLGSLLEAFWWQRYTAQGDGAMDAETVECIVDEILLPLVSSTSVGAPQPA